MAQTSEVDKLQTELSKLRSEVDNLKAVQRQGADDADPVLATKLHNSVFSWSTEDGKFSLTMTNRVQFRVTYNDERGQDIDGVSDGNNGAGQSTNGRDFFNFRVRRAKTKFEGNIFEKEFKYLVLLSWANGGDNIVEEAYFTWAKYQEINVSGGQNKVPFEYQFNVSSGKQQFVDRSVVSNTFNQGWGKGIWVNGQIGKDTPWVKYWFGIYNGKLRAQNDFRNQDLAISADAFGTGVGAVDADLMPALRVETHPLGNVADDMTDFRTREESKKVLFSVGVALNWFISRFSNTDLRPTGASPGSGRSQTGQDTINLTLDGHFRFYGLSVNIEYIHRVDYASTGRHARKPEPQGEEPERVLTRQLVGRQGPQGGRQPEASREWRLRRVRARPTSRICETLKSTTRAGRTAAGPAMGPAVDGRNRRSPREEPCGSVGQDREGRDLEGDNDQGRSERRQR
jgi:hypothetical protein